MKKHPIRQVLDKLLTFVLIFQIALGYTIFAPALNIVQIEKASSASYSAQLNSIDLPAVAYTGETIDVPVQLTNDGELEWLKLGGILSIIKLGYSLNGEEGVVTDLVQDVSVGETTGGDQSLTIEIPDAPGTYNLQVGLYDFTNSTLLEETLSSPTILNVEATIQPDITAPTGSIIIKNDYVNTQDPVVPVFIDAADPEVENSTTSGVNAFRLGSSLESMGDWVANDTFPIDYNFTIPSVQGNHNIYAQFKDAAGNISEAYSTNIELIATTPIGSVYIPESQLFNEFGQLKTLDKQLEVTLYTQSNINVVEYRLGIDENILESIDWVPFDNPQPVKNQNVNFELPEVTGTYTIYVQYRNAAGLESEIFNSQEVYYKSYVVTPALNVTSEDVLFGKDMVLNIELKNEGSDQGFNAGIQLTLPLGFEYISSSPELDETNSIPNTEEITQPSFITVDEFGKQVLVFANLDDLKANESVNLHLLIKVPGLNEGYDIGDEIGFNVKGSLHKTANLSYSYDVETYHLVKLQPFAVDLNNNIDALVEDTINNNIKIETNPEVANDSENPLTIQFELENGISYIDESQQVKINGVFVDPEEYNIIFEYVNDLINSNPVMKWIFGEGVDVNTIIELYFDTKVDKNNGGDLLENGFTHHNDEFVNNLTINGGYQDADEETCTADGLIVTCEPAIVDHSITEEQKITAKYFDIYKTSEIKGVTDRDYVLPGDTLIYTINIKTSPEYNLVGIELTDILPDGVDFDLTTANLIKNPSSLLLELNDKTLDSETGAEVLNWRIHEAQGIPAGNAYSFSYEVTVTSNYDVKTTEEGTQINSHDYLSSKVTARGIWDDTDTSYVRSEPLEDRTIEEIAWDSRESKLVGFNYGIKHTEDSDYSNEVFAHTEDVLDLYLEIIAPDSVSVDDFSQKIFFPIGTDLIEGSLIANIPVAYEEIEGGIQFNLDQVTAGTNYRIDYQLIVNDDANLKEGVLTRNLFRADYYNVDDEKEIFRGDVSINFAEPEISSYKYIKSGYLAAGENVNIRTVIVNYGSTTGYEFYVTDTTPGNTVVDESTISVTYKNSNNEEIPLPFSYDSILRRITVENLNLGSQEKILIDYTVESSPNIIFGDPINSYVFVSSYYAKNYAGVNGRTYNEKTFYTNWTANEGLVDTNLVTELDGTQFEIAEGVIPVYIDNPSIIIGQIHVNGGAPVYNGSGKLYFESLDISTATIEFILNGNPIEVDYQVENGAITFSGLNLNTDDLLEIIVTVPNAGGFNLYDESYISITVGFDNAATNSIRKDGSLENELDIDTDDFTQTNLVVVASDNIYPEGKINFLYNNEVIDFTTNQTNIQVAYTATDNIEVSGVRFSNDTLSWFTTTELNELTTQEKDTLNLSSSENWNSWNGLELILNDVLTEEGFNFRYMEIIDSSGNRTVVDNKVLLDATAPQNAVMQISFLENDFSDPEFTDKLSNFINFAVLDDCTDGEGDYSSANCSGIGFYSICVPNDVQTCFDFEGNVNPAWSDWFSANEGLNSLPFTFPEVTEGEDLVAYIRFMDLAGNVYQRSSSQINPITGLNLPNEVVMDTITYSPTEYETLAPKISFELNNDDAYTKYPWINLGLDILHPGNGVSKMRISDTPENTAAEYWSTYSVNFKNRLLIGSDTSGVKQLCAQVQDYSGKNSNIACDTIILDNTAPAGFIIINDGSYQVDTKNVNLHIAATDPDLDDGTAGAWGIQMRLSTHGENCEYLIDETEITECEALWSEWQPYSESLPWELEDYIGDHNVFIQFKDAVDNISEVSSTSVTYNPLSSDGNIVINNDDLFTNSRNVSLELSADTTPVYMRFYQLEDDSTPPAPPAVTSDVEYQNYLSNLNAGESSWSYWQEYYTPIQWDVDKTEDSNADFGYKKVCVQYVLANTQTTDVYCDSIIYAPLYAIEYLQDSTWDVNDVQNNIFGLGHIPTAVDSQDSFTIKLNAKNFGSLTWLPDGDSPVRISYKWKWVGGDLPEGWTEDKILKEYRGNSSVLADIVTWDEETGEIYLRVDTPLVPGNYELVIDAVHEGRAWFGDYGNNTPTFNILVNQNQVIPLPEPPEFSVLGETTEDSLPIGGPVPIPFEWDDDGVQDGWGVNCDDIWSTRAGKVCYIQGTWSPPRDTDYHARCASITGGYLNYEIETAFTVFGFCFSNEAYWDTLMGQQVTIKVRWEADGSGYEKITGGPTRKTWDGQYSNANNDPKLAQPIVVNRSDLDEGKIVEFTIQPKYKNRGTQVWGSNDVELISLDKPFRQGGTRTDSIFYDPGTWVNPNTIKVDKNSSGYGQNSLVPFTFKLYIPEDAEFGTHQQCFVIRNTPKEPWEYRNGFCLTIEIERTFEEQVEYFCPLPHAVYEEMDENSTVIGNIEQDTAFIIKYEVGDWLYIYYPETGQKGWTKNDFDCFTAGTLIENVLPIPEFEVTPTPTGDNGYVINLDGIEAKSGPGDLFDTVAILPYGAHVQVIGEAFIEDNKYGGWLLVRLDEKDCITDAAKAMNCEVWIPKGTTHHTNDPVDIKVQLKPDFYRAHLCGTEEIKVYRYPGIKDTPIGSFQPNQNVSILKTWNGWYQVYLNKKGDIGWIESTEGMCEGFIFPKGSLMCGGEVGYPFEKDWGTSSGYGYRTIDGETKLHAAIDIPAPYGTPVLAAEGGIVTAVSSNGGCSSSNVYGGGKFVDVYHPKLGLKTRYLHLSRFQSGLEVGDEVFQGMVIGFVGNTGCVIPRPSYIGDTAGSHLHLEVIDAATGQKYNPADFIGSGANNCPVETSSNAETTNKLAGTPGDVYGGKTEEELEKPEIRVKVTEWDDGGIELEVTDKKIPAPEITYIDINDDKSQATVYGIAVKKNQTATAKIDYIRKKCQTHFIVCLSYTYEYEYREHDIQLQNTGIGFHENVNWLFGGYPLFGWIWNDSQDGKFAHTFNLDDDAFGDINIGDSIFAKSYVWSSTSFNVNDKDYNIDLYTSEEHGVESDKSNVVKIDNKSRIDRLKYEIEMLTGFKVVEGEGQWNGDELVWMKEFFEDGSIPKNLYDHGFVNKIRREGKDPIAAAQFDYIDTQDMIIFDGALDMGGNGRYGNIDDETGFKIVLAHELAHSFEEKDKSSNNAALLSEFSAISWNEVTSVIYENWTRRLDATADDFVTPYAETHSYEDWAESVACHIYAEQNFVKDSEDLHQKEDIVNTTF